MNITSALRNIDSKVQVLIENKRILLGFALCFIALYHLPYFYLGENATLPISDNLDSNIVWIKLLIDNQMIFSGPNEPVEQVLNGIPRSSVYGLYDLSILIFNVFGMYWGYVTNKLIMSIVGFAGMYLLLKNHIVKSSRDEFIAISCALLFSILPFWSFNISVAGLPLVLFAFLNFRQKNVKVVDWIILILVPFYSSLILTGVFLLLLMLALLIYDLFRTKKLNLWFITGMGLNSISYIASHFPLFYSFIFDSEYRSHREEMKFDSFSLSNSFSEAWEMFTFGQFHAYSLQYRLLIPICLAILLQIIYRKINKTFLLAGLFIVLTSLFYGFLQWEGITDIKEDIMDIIPIQLQRFHCLHPLFWYLLLAISFQLFIRHFKLGVYFAVFILGAQTIIHFKTHELSIERSSPSFGEFYSVDQFEEIQSTINKPSDSYKVISVGMHPAIAQYNGMYTLDGYFANYPLAYKHDFRLIIEGELAQSPLLRPYYDNWGSRCYAFTSEIGAELLKPSHETINKLDFNYLQLKKMGGDYILSTATINIDNNPSLEFVKEFDSDEFYWDITLYKVNDTVFEEMN